MKQTKLKRAPSREPKQKRKPAGRSAMADEHLMLAPQTELPKHRLGEDRSTQKSNVHELSWSQFDQLIQSLARQISERFAPEAVVGVAHGGVFAGGALASALSSDFYPVRISRRSRDHTVRKAPRMFGQMPKELKGRQVLVVDDVAASGETLELAISQLKKLGAKSVQTATLLSRVKGYSPDWVALLTDNFVVFPWDYGPVVEDARFEVDPDKAGA